MRVVVFLKSPGGLEATKGPHSGARVHTSQPSEGQAPPVSILSSVPVGVHATKKQKTSKGRR